MVVVCSEGSLTPRKYKPIFFVRCNAFEVFLVLRVQMFSVGRVTAVPARVRRSRRKRSLFPKKMRPCPRQANESVTKNNLALIAQFTSTVTYFETRLF